MSSIFDQSMSDLIRKDETITKKHKKEDQIKEDQIFVQHLKKIVFIKRMPYHPHLYISESESKIYVFVITEESLKYLTTSYCGKHSKYHGSQPISKSFWYGELEDNLDRMDGSDISRRLGETLEHKRIPLPKSYICTENGKNIWKITDKKKENIYYVIKKENGKLNVYSEPIDLNTFRDDLLENIIHTDEQGVKNLGSILRVKLIPSEIQATLKEELQSGNEKIKDVWVFCEGLDIGYLWEWIYWEEKNFFWGDEFSIVRVQKGCDMSECPVNKKIFILANDSDPHSNAFVKKLKSKLQEAGVKDRNLKVIRSPKGDLDFLVDCIILYVVGTDESIRRMYESKLKGIFIGNGILFFNLYPSGPLRLDGLPAAWIDSRFDNIKEEFTLTFVKCFFKVFLNESKKVRVTEIVAKAREMMAGENILGRLGCVVNGNPNITLIA